MTDSSGFDHVLSICLDRLCAGDGLASCLASYPSYAERLAPLLRVASTLQTPDGPFMSSEGFGAGQARLLARAAQLRVQRGRALPARRRAVLGLLAGSRRLIAAAVAGVLLLCGVLSAGTVSAASTSLPGGPLYPVKRATEDLVSSVAFTPQLQARVHLAWADRRLREIEALVARDGVADEAVLTALDQETEQALTAAEQSGIEQLTAVVVHTGHQQTVLERVMAKAPEAAWPGLGRAMEASAQGHARARYALERATSPGPPSTPPGRAKDKETPDTAPGAPAAVDTTTPGTQGEYQPPGTGQGQGVEVPPGKGAGQGHGQDQDQDKAEDPKRGQGHGDGPDKKNEPHPLDDGKGRGVAPAPRETSGTGHSDEKHGKADNPGQGKVKSK